MTPDPRDHPADERGQILPSAQTQPAYQETQPAHQQTRPYAEPQAPGEPPPQAFAPPPAQDFAPPQAQAFLPPAQDFAPPQAQPQPYLQPQPNYPAPYPQVQPQYLPPQVGYAYYPVAQTWPGPPVLTQSNGQATAAMVLGILAVVIQGLGLVTLALGVLAFSLGLAGLSKSRRTGTGRGQAAAGITLGIIGLCIYLVIGFLTVGTFLII